MAPREIDPFSWRVIDRVQKLIALRETTDAQVIRDSGIPRNTFYRKMRGETPLDTDDIAKLASALSVEPEVLFSNQDDFGLVAKKRGLDRGQGDYEA
ncbi:helix-turn-helix domain-containing protein [Microbacterium excoecariae]|uniref:helix-turn-helix domain-containing protein n=1 Tax=Microbacterium excoecariae TaxID=2715210 RepID=UPI00140B12CA|nr:helix-turn-helix transcriptional regulator [Microbacterium excoecariae]NHI16830.1 helix-turn-helix transcriptional regulator [Microbacterium excoecariae]